MSDNWAEVMRLTTAGPSLNPPRFRLHWEQSAMEGLKTSTMVWRVKAPLWTFAALPLRALATPLASNISRRKELPLDPESRSESPVAQVATCMRRVSVACSSAPLSLVCGCVCVGV